MRFKLLLSILLCSLYSSAQLVPVGSWRLHLNYGEAVSVTEANDKIFCASKSAVYFYNKADNSVSTITKITGLSDIDINSVKYNPTSRSVIVAYTNTNIDIIEGNTVTNISDIKRKPILGNKTINNVYCNGKYAYLSCGFGIVVIDMLKKEVSDTYYIGDNGDVIQVFDITADSTYLYAATETGVRKAIKNSAAISNYSSWEILPGLSKGYYNSVTYFNNKLYANRSLFLEKSLGDADTLFVSNGSNWTVFSPISGQTINFVRNYYGKLVVSGTDSAQVYDASDNLVKKLKHYAFFTQTQEVIIDKDNAYWIADEASGLTKIADNSSSQLSPNGPFRATTYAMAFADQDLWVVPGGHNIQWGSVYLKTGVSAFVDNKWTTFNGYIDTLFNNVFDIMTLAIDPLDKTHVFAGSWGRGLIEFVNRKPVDAIYNETNSLLQRLPDFPNYYWVGVGGLAFDQGDNLWMTNSGVSTPLVVRKKDKTWKAFDLGSLLRGQLTANLLIDDYGQKWIMSPLGGGIVVFSEGKDIDDVSDDKYKKLNVSVNFNGSIVNGNVQCMVKDLDGAIWIGTDVGVAVYYSPGDVLSTNDEVLPQQILIQQDGYNQYLFANETVTAIAVDGANRKWVGTQKGGVYLVSADGTKQVLHFTSDNSPLLSDAVSSIVINDKTGEVFFGSEKGISSYRGSATKGNDGFTGVYSFPNPVPQGYTGTIAIKGLVEKAIIKITDVNGNVVYETKSEGGQAVWDGNNLFGTRVDSGVYLVFCTTTDGQKTEVSKLLFIK